MSYFLMMLKIAFVFLIIFLVLYFLPAKLKQRRFSRESQTGRIKVVDGLMIDNTTSAYIISVDNENVFLVSGNNGMQLCSLKNNDKPNVEFQTLLEEKIEMKGLTEQ